MDNYENNEMNGADTQNNGNTQAGQPAGGYNYSAGYQKENQSDGMAVASLVLGILSIVCCMPCGIAGLILSIIYKNKVSNEKRGLITAGMITSIVGVVLGIILIIGWVIVQFINASQASRYSAWWHY